MVVNDEDCGRRLNAPEGGDVLYVGCLGKTTVKLNKQHLKQTFAQLPLLEKLFFVLSKIDQCSVCNLDDVLWASDGVPMAQCSSDLHNLQCLYRGTDSFLPLPVAAAFQFFYEITILDKNPCDMPIAVDDIKEKANVMRPTSTFQRQYQYTLDFDLTETALEALFMLETSLSALKFYITENNIDGIKASRTSSVSLREQGGEMKHRASKAEESEVSMERKNHFSNGKEQDAYDTVNVKTMGAERDTLAPQEIIDSDSMPECFLTPNKIISLVTNPGRSISDADCNHLVLQYSYFGEDNVILKMQIFWGGEFQE